MMAPARRIRISRLPGQDAFVGAPGRAAHDVGAGRVDAERHGGRAVHDDVDPEDLDRGQWCGEAGGGGAEEGEDGSGVGRQLEPNEFDDVVVDCYLTSTRDGRRNRYQMNCDLPLRHPWSANTASGKSLTSCVAGPRRPRPNHRVRPART
jgi:hypothetical protein